MLRAPAEFFVLWARFNALMAQEKYHKAAKVLAEIEALPDVAG